MSKNYKLQIELVPESCWYTNVRSIVTRSQWDKLRKECYTRAKHKCEICDGSGLSQGFKWPVECHEIWHYDDNKKHQKLIGLISLCPYCHKVKHPGLASMKGEMNIVINQLMKVNNISRLEANEYITESFKIFENRSKYKWTSDISYIDNYFNNEKDIESLF